MFKKLLSSIFQTPESSSTQVTKHSDDKGLIHSLYIPEPTRSLLFLTDDDTNLIASPMSINIRFAIDSGKIDIDEKTNFYAEPSLIWTRLEIHENSDLEKNPLYFPVYAAFTPDQRFQYLKWLENIEKPTNLSYVFLYYYGLERHLLLGDFDKALGEVKRLADTQDPKLKKYINGPLLMSIGMRNRLDTLPKLPFLFDDQDNLTLWIRHMSGDELKANDIIKLSYQVGFTNKRYIKMYPETFEKILDINIQNYLKNHGPILRSVDLKTLSKYEASVFLNISIPDEYRRKMIPDFLSDKEFTKTLKDLLQTTHTQIKETKTANSTLNEKGQ